jgi:hypothetical protein
MFKNTIIVYHCNLCLNLKLVNTKLIGSMFVKGNKLNKGDFGKAVQVVKESELRASILRPDRSRLYQRN